MELSRLESVDFWTPDANVARKLSTYSNSGVDRSAARPRAPETAQLVPRRYAIKSAILGGSNEEVLALVEGELKALVHLSPEINLQVEMLSFGELLKEQGEVGLVRRIKEKYSDMASESVILCRQGQFTYVTVSQLAAKLLLSKPTDGYADIFDRKNAALALWEKVNSTILGIARLT